MREVTAKLDKIRRYIENAELRTAVAEGNQKIISGHAAVFNQEIKLNYFREKIDSKAFDKTDMSDVFLFVNHKSLVPLARSKAGNANSTMTLSIDEKGLAIRAVLDIEGNSESKKLYSAIQRGDISGMSFAFTVESEEWSDLESDYPLRTIKSISKIFEVSVVTYPAYDQTDVSARNNEEEILKAAKEKYPPLSQKLNNYREKIKIIGGMKI